MKLEEVRNMEWIPVTDWSGLTMTANITGLHDAVNASDITNFVENCFRDVARKLNFPYNELLPILKEENSAFYATKKSIFGKIQFLYETNPALLMLEKMLRIPDASRLNNVEKILSDFSSLSDCEKLEVLQRLKIISIKVECNHDDTSPDNPFTLNDTKKAKPFFEI